MELQEEKVSEKVKNKLGNGILDSCLISGKLAITAVGECDLAVWIHARTRLVIRVCLEIDARNTNCCVSVAWSIQALTYPIKSA